MEEVNLSILDETGARQELKFDVTAYREAQDAGLTLGQLCNTKYRTDSEKHGTAFAQILASAGMFLHADTKYGVRPPTVAELYNGDARKRADVLLAFTRPDGSKSDTASGRLLFPAVLMELIEASLRPNIESYIASFMAMVATTVNINTPKYEQPIVDFTDARNSRSQPIGQLDLPPVMAKFKVSDVSKTLPTYSVGVEISDQATRALTIDFIAKCIAEQQIFERSSRMTDDLVGIVTGDVDSGQTALTGFAASTLDAAATGGVLTQKAWVKYLRKNYMKMTITDIICDVDTYLAIQNRTGRPIFTDQSTTDERLNTTPRIVNAGIPGATNIFVTDGSPLGTNTLLGLDRSKALRRVVYVGAAYNEIERWVLRRGQALRMDWSERVESMGLPDAFSLMTLT